MTVMLLCIHKYIYIYIFPTPPSCHTHLQRWPTYMPTYEHSRGGRQPWLMSISITPRRHASRRTKKKRFSHQTTTKITRNFSHEFRCIYFFRRFFPATAYKIIRRRFKKNAELHRQRAKKVSHLLWKTSTIHIAH